MISKRLQSYLLFASLLMLQPVFCEMPQRINFSTPSGSKTTNQPGKNTTPGNTSIPSNSETNNSALNKFRNKYAQLRNESVDDGTVTQVASSESDLIPYAFPGIVGFKDGRLVGSDHLLNLSDHISVFAEISLPDNQKVPVTAKEIEERVREIFQKNNIVPRSDEAAGKPNLPFFHILVFVFSIPEGFIYNVSGRLFEEVTLPRINLPDGLTMQAITWDREGLRASSKQTFKDELFESVDETVNSFIERFKFFSNIKANQQNN